MTEKFCHQKKVSLLTTVRIESRWIWSKNHWSAEWDKVNAKTRATRWHWKWIMLELRATDGVKGHKRLWKEENGIKRKEFQKISSTLPSNDTKHKQSLVEGQAALRTSYLEENNISCSTGKDISKKMYQNSKVLIKDTRVRNERAAFFVSAKEKRLACDQILHSTCNQKSRA